ncbi:MAG TPA: glycosyltransferase [Rariglobus sp.]|nr:glycosyltransferase [Rariglobus sp.]
MNTASPELSVILPAYEEAENLDMLLPALHGVLKGMGISYEIIVVDAATPRDATPAICERHLVRYVSRVGGGLYGHAIRTAQTVALGRYVIMMDADGSHGPSFIPKLWACREEAGIVVASRYVRGGQTENPAILILMSMVVNYVFRICLGLRCADVSNSFRLYQGGEFRGLTLSCDHFDIVEEILIKLYFARKNYVVKEIPFTFEKRKAGKTKRKLLTFAIGYIFTLIRLRRFKKSMRKLASTHP